MTIKKNPDGSYSIYDKTNDIWVTVTRKDISAITSNRPRYKHPRKPDKP